MNKQLFLVINEDRFFLSHRLPIALAAKENGYDVTIICKNTGRFEEIESYDFETLELPINPTGMDIREELKTFLYLLRLYRKRRPNIVHHVGMKSILWGGLAAKVTGIQGVVSAVSGLGGLFNNTDKSIISKILLNVLKSSHKRKGIKVIFQNKEDESIFLSHGIVNKENIAFTKGSGIDLKEYHYISESEGIPVQIIFTARMVKEKGVCDIIDAAEILKPKFHNKVKFILCGRLTTNSSSISQEYLDKHCDGDYISYLGERNDIHQLLESSHIMLFPSYYREGLPKSLIEASAVGRPIITCNSTGCKDVVDDGVNGYLVEPRNPKMIADRLERLINNPHLRIKMGEAAREKAEKEFSIEEVVATHLHIYQSLLET